MSNQYDHFGRESENYASYPAEASKLPSLTDWHSPIGRLTFFGHLMVLNVISAIPGMILYYMDDVGVNFMGGMFFIVFLYIIFAILMVMMWASMVRRLIDLRLSKWMVLLSFIPGVNLIFLGGLLFAPGETFYRDHHYFTASP